MLGEAIREQSKQMNKILRNVNAAVMNHSSKAVDTGEKLIAEFGHYRYCGCWASDRSYLFVQLPNLTYEKSMN
jgi:hypothetical protein